MTTEMRLLTLHQQWEHLKAAWQEQQQPEKIMIHLGFSLYLEARELEAQDIIEEMHMVGLAQHRSLN